MKAFSLRLIIFFAAGCISLCAQNAGAPQKPFTVSASLREEYDDNIFTAANNPDASMKTILEPSFLYNLKREQTEFSARYTLGATAYTDRDKTWDFSHELLARVNHKFSERFNLDVRNRLRFAQEPEVTNGAAVARVDGDYLNNVFTAQGTAQWTPKFGTVTTYTNDYLDYSSATQTGNDRIANTFSNDFRFVMLPTTTLVVGASYNNYDYFKRVALTSGERNRDWQSFSPYVGVDYALTPQLTLAPRVGITYTDNSDSQAKDEVTPYGAFTADWKIGARSSLTFNYSYSVAPTDIITFSSQNSNSFSLTGRYQLTPLIMTRATLYYNLGENSADSALNAGQATVNESTIGVDLGASYELNKFLSLEAGYIFNTVDSDLNGRDYERNRVYIGVRATY